MNIVGLKCNHCQQTGLKWATDGKAVSLHASFEPLFLLQLELPRIVFERRWNFCLIVIKIWSTLLCSLARRSVCVCVRVSVWAACLTSDEFMPPCPWASATHDDSYMVFFVKSK